MGRSKIIVASCAAAAVAAGAGSSAPSEIGFPDGYRHWTHVTSAIGHPPAGNPKLRFDGMHHIYANDIAVDGYRTGAFRDGAILVFDRFGVEASPGGIEPTERLSIDVMIRESTRFANSGGWGFERFGDEDMRTPVIDESERQQCASCHRKVESRGMVFSRLEDARSSSAQGASRR